MDISDTSVYDGGDYLYTEWTFRIGGVIFPGVYGGGEPPATALARIEHYLEQPRKRLTYTVNGVKILDIAGNPNVTGLGDCANGPFPKVLSVVRVDGGAAIWVEYEVTARVRTCPGGPAQQYLSNRWKESVTIDDECRTTRTRIGRIVLRSDTGGAPDTFRGLVTPPIPVGFMRESSQYELTEDGLRIQYQFIDKEVYALPPYTPYTAGRVFKAAGTYKETCTNGAIRHAEVNVSLVGDFRSNRRELLATAITIAVQRLDRSGIARSDKTGRWLATGAFSENLYEPKVEVSLRAMLKPGPAPADGRGVALTGNRPPTGGTFFGGLGAPITMLGILGNTPGNQNRIEATINKPVEAVNVPGKPSVIGGGWGELPFGSANAQTPDPGIRGTAGLKLLAAALNDPCLNQTVLNAELSSSGSRGAPLLAPTNQDPGASSGGGAGSTMPPSDPFFNPNAFLGRGGT